MHILSSSLKLSLGTIATLLSLPALSQSPPIANHIKVHQTDVPFIPTEDLPPPNPASKCDEIVTLFNQLTDETEWDLVQKTLFKADTGEPEGMVRLSDDRYFVSAGKFLIRPIPYLPGVIINGTDRSPGSGYARLLLFDGEGNLIADATHSEKDEIEYHPGGIDYDGEFIWSAIAQYRPNTTAKIVKIDPRTLTAGQTFRASDHFGAMVHDTETDKLLGLNWGGRNASTWDLADPSIDPNKVLDPISVELNPNFTIDYQDCKFLGHPQAYDGRAVMICSGVSGGTGGIALVDMETMKPLSEISLDMKSVLGSVITQNPFDVDVVEGKLRLYFLPDMHISTLHVYEAK